MVLESFMVCLGFLFCLFLFGQRMMALQGLYFYFGGARLQMARYLSRERNNTHLHHLNIKRSKPSNVKKGKSSSYKSNLLNTSSKLMPISSVQMPPPLKKSTVEHKQHLKEIIQQYFITKHNRQLRDRKERHLTMI